MKTLPRIVATRRTPTMYVSFAPVPNHSGAGSVSRIGSQRTMPALKKAMCSNACRALDSTAPS